MYSARDIRNLESQLKKRTLGGYDADSVKAQLTALAQQWEQMEEARRGAEDKVRELEDKLRHYEKVELALQEALETARDTARRTEESADRKARLIVEEAELRAQRIIQEAEQERYGLRQDLSHLTNKQTEVAARLRSFLMSELEMLAQFQGEDPVGFIKLVAPDRTAGERTLPAHAPELAEASSDAFDESVEEEDADLGLHEPEDVAPTEDVTIEDESDTNELPFESPDGVAPQPEDTFSSRDEEDDPQSTMDAAPAEPESPEEPVVTDARGPEEMEGRSYEAPNVDPMSVGEDIPDAELTDAERAGLGVRTEGAATADLTFDSSPKPVVPKSPWPDVDESRPRHTVWPPVPRAHPDGPTTDAEPDTESSSEEPVSHTPPSAAPSWTSPGAFSSDPDPAPPGPPETEGGWSLRSLVTGDDTTEADKDKHREAVRRIMEDMD